MHKLILKYLQVAGLALGFGLASIALGQGITSSTISGSVTDSSGKPVSGATVTVFYQPTNSTSTATTNASGRYNLPGLRVGGPYTVTATGNGFKSKDQQAVQLELAQVFEADFSLEAGAGASDVVKMEAFVATESSTTLFDGLTTGSGSQISLEKIEAVPTVSRSINEFARLDPRVVITDRTNGEMSAGGQNGRYNALLIDGVRSNDVFGLTNNGLPAQNNPISIDVIEAFDVAFSPYDVRQSGFTGAAVNAVTKSGTNQFHGMAQYIWTTQNMRARNPDSTSTLFNTREKFKEETRTAQLGGPIIKDKLFFFLGYEKFSRTELAPTAGFTPSQAAIDQIKATLKVYNYDPGSLTSSGSQEKKDDKTFAKLDWNISPNHRLMVRYNKTDAEQPIFQDYNSTSAVSFSGHWYVNHQLNKSYVGELFSTWSPNFTTEAKFAYSQYKTDRVPNSIFPQVVITGVPASTGTGTGNVYVGTERSTQVNHLNVHDRNATVIGTYLLGDHTVTFGVDYEKSSFYNAFMQDAYGSYGTGTNANAGYTFSTLTNAGFPDNPTTYSYQYSPNGGSIAADWSFSNPAYFLQDTWRPINRLTVTGGIRLDTYSSTKPLFNSAFSSAFGIRNDNSIDGLDVVSPRIGFNYALDNDKKTQIRGGVGKFQGRAPGVWMSNAYSNNGVLIAQSTKATIAPTIVSFSPNPDAQTKGGSTTYAVNLLDNSFKLPAVIKTNLAVDRKLPWMGLVATLEYNYTKTLENFYYQDLNAKKIGFLPDGREFYSGRINAAYTNVLVAKNTDKGSATQATVQLQKPWKNNWFASLSYTNGRAYEVSPVTSSTASTNTSARIIFNQDEQLSRSNYEIRHRFLGNLSRRFFLLDKSHATMVAFQYEVRSGRPYSYTFSNDANGDGFSGNDEFYVPTGPNDPKAHWATQSQSDAFFAWLSGQKDLAKYAGTVAPRNSGTSRTIQQLDLRLSQELPIWGNVKAELFYDVLNLGNLINKKWGQYTLVGFPYNYFVASGVPDASGTFYNYTFASTPRGQLLDNAQSRWQMQAGIKVKF